MWNNARVYELVEKVHEAKERERIMVKYHAELLS